MATWSDVITDALTCIGAASLHETTSSVYIDSALRRLNLLLASWGTQGMLAHESLELSFTTIAGQSTYEIGSGQYVSTTSFPRTLDHVSDSSRRALDILSLGDFNRLNLSSTSGVPTYCALEVYATKSILNLSPSPGTADTITVKHRLLPSEVAKTDTIALGPAFTLAFTYELALHLAPNYGSAAVITPQFERLAARSMEDYVRSRLARPRVQYGSPGGFYIRDGD